MEDLFVGFGKNIINIRMKIYLSHSRFNEEYKDLYKAIRDSELDITHSIILPHENSQELFDIENNFGCWSHLRNQARC